VIARLEGVLIESTPTRVVLDVGGVGYEALIPLSTFSQLPEEGKTVALRIHTHVREDALQLFGFASDCEREVFQLLIQASRVGPKLAQTILSGMDARELAAAIRGGDVAALKSVPGVGSKTAERIVVELRDRIGEALLAGLQESSDPSGAAREPDLRHQLVSALTNLQTPKPKAERVADEVIGELGGTSIEALVRAALQRMAR